MAVKSADEEKGATEFRKGASAVEKGEKGAASADEDKGATAEGKRKVSEEEEAVLKLTEEVEWKWKIGTAGNGEGEPKPRRERRRWRSTRKDSGAAADKEEVTAAEKELAGEKPIFFFSAAAAGKKVDPVSSEGKLSEEEEAVRKLSEEAEWKWKIATPGDEEEEAPKPRRERRRWRSTRREPSAATAEAPAKEVAGEKAIFFFGAAAAGKMISLVSSEGKPFKMSEAAARLSAVLADMVDHGCAGGIIPLPNVDARALATVIKYCDKHAAAQPNSGAGSSSSTSVDTAASEKTLDEWDRKLVDDLTQDALYDIIGAANFLNIKGLLDAACQKVADMIKGKTVEQIRSIFDIASGFTAEEEAEIRKESPWAFED
ncbi:unnamed protein product [Urochloa humidicola]